MSFNTGYANTDTAPKKSWFGPGMLIGLMSLLLVGFLAFFLVATYVKYHNLGVSSENDIKAQYDSNQNNLGQLALKVKDALGIAKLNNAELDKVLRGAVAGRYGENGAQQAMLWVKENYPGSYDPSLMKNVQQTVLAGRTDFEAKQNILIDKVRVYKNLTQFVWSGFWLKLSGYPTLNWDTYKPVVADSTKQTFDTKVDKGFDIK